MGTCTKHELLKERGRKLGRERERERGVGGVGEENGWGMGYVRNAVMKLNMDI